MKRHYFLFLFSTMVLTSCFDLYTPTKNIPGPYYLSPSESNGGWTLYYDLGGAGIGRIDMLKRIGWTDKYIFAENSNDKYFFLDKAKDESLLNADEIVIGPFEQSRFKFLLDSLQIKKFEFEINIDK